MVDDRDDDREALIRQRAQRLWEQEGRPEGHHLRHWDSARRQIEEEKSGLLHGSVDADALAEEPGAGDQPFVAETGKTRVKPAGTSASRAKRAGTPKRSG